MGGKCSKPARLVGQQLTARQALDQALRQAADADLRTDQCTGQHGACLVLSTTIDGLQHTGLEIAGEAGRKIVGSRKLKINGARQAIDIGNLPGGLDVDCGVTGGPHGGANAYERIRRWEVSAKLMLGRVRVRGLAAIRRDVMEGQAPSPDEIQQPVADRSIQRFATNQSSKDTGIRGGQCNGRGIVLGEQCVVARLDRRASGVGGIQRSNEEYPLGCLGCIGKTGDFAPGQSRLPLAVYPPGP